MAWVKTGTVAVTNGSTTVTGTGTSWFGALQTGWGFVGPDQGIYEILTVDSATEITLATPYLGANASAQSYAAFPTNSLSADLTATLQALIANYQGVYDTVGQGRFLDGVLAAPGMAFDADRDTGILRPGANILALVAGAVEQLRLTDGVASGAAVQSTASDTDGDGKLVRMEGAGAAALSRFGIYKSSGDGYNIDQAVAGDLGLVSTSNPGTWPSENPGPFAWVTSQSIYSDAAVLQRAIYGYASTGTPGNVRTFERIRANDGSAWSEWTEVVTSANV
ncbi:hypothetical protein SM763_21295, partial [Pseudophaeobacter sp. C1-32P7]